MSLNIKTESMNDAIGGTVVVGDWVAFAYGNGHGSPLSIGKIERFNDKSMIVVRRRGKPMRKLPNQIIKITDEQVMLHLFMDTK